MLLGEGSLGTGGFELLSSLGFKSFGLQELVLEFFFKLSALLDGGVVLQQLYFIVLDHFEEVLPALGLLAAEGGVGLLEPVVPLRLAGLLPQLLLLLDRREGIRAELKLLVVVRVEQVVLLLVEVLRLRVVHLELAQVYLV